MREEILRENIQTGEKIYKLFALILLLASLAVFSGIVDVLPARSAEVIKDLPDLPVLVPLSPTSSSHCPALPAASGNIVNVSSVSQLENAVNTATSGDTVLIANGTYDLNGVYLRVDTPNVTLRSASGVRDAVILDGNYITTEIIQVVESNVAIADITLREAYNHPIHVMTGSSDTLNTLIYNVHIVDPGEQAIKINPAGSGYPNNGTIACSHIELTDTGRPSIRNNCYTGGIDAHQAQGWTVRDNLIEGFWCSTGLSEHGVHMWNNSRDTVVERNELVNNARGVGFGLGSSGHSGGIIRNNMIHVMQDVGIGLESSPNTRVYNNTVFTENYFNSIEYRFGATSGIEIINNVTNQAIVSRDGGSGTVQNNVTNAQSSWFVSATTGDLHLVSDSISSVIDQGQTLASVSDDFDGDSRPIGSAPDIGADEYGIPSPSAVTNLRLTQGVTSANILAATLSWLAPTDAVTYTLRYSNALITNANWNSAIDITVPFTAATAGNTEWLTPTVPYNEGNTAYFAIKSQNVEGDWSNLSNNAYWPFIDVYLPVILK